MDCYDFIYYLGSSPNSASLSEEDIQSNAKFSAINRLISGCLVFFFSIFFLTLRIFFKKKLNDMVNASIFSIFDDLSTPEYESISENTPTIEANSPNSGKYKIDEMEKSKENEVFYNLRINSDEVVKSTSFPSFDAHQFRLLNKEIKSALKKESKPNQENEKIVYLCNFEECCCDCCCQWWYLGVYKNIKGKWKRFSRRFKNFFRKNLKIFCFYFLMIGTFIYNPLRNFLSFIFNNCNLEAIYEPTPWPILMIFNLIDLFCGGFAFVLYFFVISFLNTEAEFQKIYLFDRGYRARLMYYHLKKALIFGVFHVCLKFFYKNVLFLFSKPFDQAVDNGYDAAWLIFKHSFLFISTKLYNKTLINNSIDQDCSTLRAHARYFAIQSHLLKGIPRAPDVYHILKNNFTKKISINNQSFGPISPIIEGKEKILCILDEKMDKKCANLENSINEEVSIIETQKFKNFNRSEGFMRYIPRIFILLIWLVCLMTIMICSILIMVMNKHLIYPDIYDWADKAYAAVWFCECSFLPFLIYFSLKKATYLPIRKVK